MSAIEKTSGTCVPPEAYIRLWKASAEKNAEPKFKSTYTPQKHVSKNGK
jgi:hypothetical protein